MQLFTRECIMHFCFGKSEKKRIFSSGLKAVCYGEKMEFDEKKKFRPNHDDIEIEKQAQPENRLHE